MYTIIYFGLTANVLHLASLLADYLWTEQDHLLPLEFSNPGQLVDNGHLILFYPIHAFDVPRTVKRFVKDLSVRLYSWSFTYILAIELISPLSLISASIYIDVSPFRSNS